MSVQLDFAKAGAALRAAIYDELLAMMLNLQGIIQRNTPRATNALAGSWLVTGQAATAGMAVQVGSPLWETYGSYPEFGTKPHWAPIEPLITWVREKGLDQLSVDIRVAGGKAKRVRGQSKPDYREAKIRRIAHAIQVKIARDGTRAQRYVLAAIEQMGFGWEERHDTGGSYYLLDPSPLLNNGNIARRFEAGLS